MKGRDIILGILNQGDKTGYQINEVLKEQLAYFYDGGYGMIYPTLKKLETEDKINKKVILQSGKPNKNVYSINDRGKQEFMQYLNSATAIDSFKSDFLIRLFFSDQLSHEELVQLITNEIARKKQQLSILKADYERWQQNGITVGKQLTVHYGISQYQAAIDVLQSELKHLK